MTIDRFVAWSRTAAAGERAEAVGALARAYLASSLPEQDRSKAEVALAAILDDPSPLVRLALAEAFATSPEVPRPMVLALAHDHSAIAALVLCGSPMLSDSDLVDCAALGDERAQTAIALRPQVSAAVAGALAEVAAPSAIIELLRNPGATLADISLRRIAERLAGRADVREALLARGNLPIEVKHGISVALSRSLAASTVADRSAQASKLRGRLVREAQDRTALTLADSVAPQDVQRLVAYLRQTGQLTPALLLRALLSHGLAFVEAALAELTGTPPARVAVLLHQGRGSAFSALYDKAGLPRSLKPAFAAALAVLQDNPAPEGEAGLSRRLIERVLTACMHSPEASGPETSGAALSLLRQYQAEVAREEVRARGAAPHADLVVGPAHGGLVEDPLDDLFQRAA